ncbi:DUF4292 domain-containing protein [Chlorobium phaeobacteroides]|nr:DUF4292 domain-containing protein [Chlorobium phaeobacteroides]
MKRGITVVMLLVIQVFLAGCGDFETVKRDDVPAEEIALTPELLSLYKEVAKASPFVKSVEGYADIWIKTPKKSQKVYCSIQLQRARDARLIISAGLLGWPVADVYFSPDSLYVHDILNNTLLTGRNTQENLGKLLGVDSGYEMFSESLLGLIKIKESVSALRSVKKNGDKLMFTFKSGSGTREALIDASAKTLTDLYLRDSAGQKTAELHFREFQSYSVDDKSVLVPGEIEMMRYEKSSKGAVVNTLLIVYDERSFNKPSESIEFRRPENVKLIRLDDVVKLPWLER